MLLLWQSSGGSADGDLVDSSLLLGLPGGRGTCAPEELSGVDLDGERGVFGDRVQIKSLGPVERPTKSERDKDRDRQTYRQTETETNRNTETDRDRETKRDAQIERERERGGGGGRDKTVLCAAT